MQGRFFIAATVAACVIMFVAWQQFYEPMQREILSVQLETRHGELSTLAAAKGL